MVDFRVHLFDFNFNFFICHHSWWKQWCSYSHSVPVFAVEPCALVVGLSPFTQGEIFVMKNIIIHLLFLFKYVFVVIFFVLFLTATEKSLANKIPIKPDRIDNTDLQARQCIVFFWVLKLDVIVVDKYFLCGGAGPSGSFSVASNGWTQTSD